MPEQQPTVSPQEALNHHIAAREGTVSFKLAHEALFKSATSDRTHVLVNATGTTADGVEVDVQVYRDDEENDLVYEYTQVGEGQSSRRQCRVSLDDWRFNSYERYIVFLVWSPAETRLHIGPIVDDEEDGELRDDAWTKGS